MTGVSEKTPASFLAARIFRAMTVTRVYEGQSVDERAESVRGRGRDLASELNPEQAAAATFGNGPLLIIPTRTNPTWGVAVTRHHHWFTLVHPSGLPLTCDTRSERASLGFPPGFAPGHY